ncbi:MAG: bacteriophage abortive infection AbiH family protein [Bilifractor sp.]
MKTLYIIGNGFDRAHGLNTSYWDFRSYLQENAENFLIEFEKIYGYHPMDIDDYYIPMNKQNEAIKRRNDILYNLLWKNFEYSLGELDESEIEAICRGSIDSMQDIEFGDIEDTLNAYFDKQFNFISSLQEYVKKWAEQINVDNVRVLKMSILNDKKDYFLTFNYTPVLEKIYNIDEEQICHIHGGISPYCSVSPIIGHGNCNVMTNHCELMKKCFELFDEGGVSMHRAFINFYKRTFKNTQNFLHLNSFFFDKLEDVSRIAIIGHSLGKVDLPYFERIYDITGRNIPWIIYYYHKDELKGFKKAIRDLDVSNIIFEPSDNFWF